MKALTWHGNRDVRVDTHPDPTIQEPTDAIIRVTSSGLCGSDLHLYEVLGAFLDEGDILGHEPMGVVEAGGTAGARSRWASSRRWVRRRRTSRPATASSSRSTSRASSASCATTGCSR